MEGARRPDVRHYRTARRAPRWLVGPGREFREFVLRGNMVELAVAVVVGAASQAVIQAIVRDLITPLIAAFYHKRDFAGIVIEVGASRFRIGHFLNALIGFLIVAAVVFFFIIKPVNALRSRMQTELDIEQRKRPCPFCKSQIPVTATRCAFCAADVPVESPTVAMVQARTDRDSTT